MFDIGWGELLVIGVVALVAIGPKELPGVLRTVGQWTGKLRRMATEFQNQFHEAMREAELSDLKKQVDDITSEVRSYGSFDPVSDVRRELEKTQSQIESAMAEKPTAEKATPQSVAENLRVQHDELHGPHTCGRAVRCPECCCSGRFDGAGALGGNQPRDT